MGFPQDLDRIDPDFVRLLDDLEEERDREQEEQQRRQDQEQPAPVDPATTGEQ